MAEARGWNFWRQPKTRRASGSAVQFPDFARGLNKREVRKNLSFYLWRKRGDGIFGDSQKPVGQATAQFNSPISPEG